MGRAGLERIECALETTQCALDSDSPPQGRFVPSVDGDRNTYLAQLSRGCEEPGHFRKGGYLGRRASLPGSSGWPVAYFWVPRAFCGTWQISGMKDRGFGVVLLIQL